MSLNFNGILWKFGERLEGISMEIEIRGVVIEGGFDGSA
jgi:hypothetical protein